MSKIPAIVSFSAVDKISKALNNIKSKFPEIEKGVRRTNTAFGLLQQSSEKVRKSFDKFGRNLKNVGQTMSLAFTAPAVAAGAFSIKAFADYETALVGVGKTTNLQGEELEALGKRFLNLSKEIPVSAEELLGLGQTAAQLGVSGSENVLKFSETLAKLSRASDVAGEEGAASLARFITVTGGAIQDVDKYASSLVALGNTSAATENEILELGLRLGASTAVFNVTGQQAFGMATALKSVGIQAEAGSSSVQRALGQINEAVLGGGKKMEALSKLTGIATGELKERFKTDAIGVLREFAAGMARVEQRGGDMTKVLETFGLTGVRDIQVMGSLAKNVDLLDEKIRTATNGFEENAALNQEFAAASKTLDNQFQLLRNTIFEFAVEIGQNFKPTLISIFEVIKSIFGFLKSNPTLTNFLLILGGILAVLGPILFALGAFMTILPGLITAFNAFVAVLAAFKVVGAIVAGVFGVILSPIGLIVAAVVGLIALLYVFRDSIFNALTPAFDWLSKKFSFFIDTVGALGSSLKRFLGFGGSNAEPGQAATGGAIAPQGAALSPQGAPLGGLETNARANSEFITQTNNARIDVNVRAPQSTTIRTESKGGFLNVNRGLAGAF